MSTPLDNGEAIGKPGVWTDQVARGGERQLQLTMVDSLKGLTYLSLSEAAKLRDVLDKWIKEEEGRRGEVREDR